MKNFLLTTLTILCAACSSASSQEPGDTDWRESGGAELATPTFEQFKASSTTTIEGKHLFVVEQDMMFDSESVLKDIYDDLYVKPTTKSIINTVGGVRDKRSDATDIKYCFSDGWGLNQGSYTAPALNGVRTAIQQAMAAWEGIANVRFEYVSSLDGASCTNSGANPGVSFVVQHYRDPSIAKGPFPSNSWATQQLLIPTSGMTRLWAIHEIGHTLGYRHEHIHSGASPRCTEGDTHYEELTTFDTLSVMKYLNCSAGSSINGTELSQLDGIGARLVYGPPNWWWAVLTNTVID